MSDTCGPELREPLAIYDPGSCVWKMYGGMFPSDSMPSLATLPAWGMTRRGELFELPMPVLPTGEPASSSLLTTPTTSGDGVTTETAQRRIDLRGSARCNLSDQVVALMPTPVADNSRGLPSASTDYASLANAAVSLLPTPTSSVSSDGITRERAAERAAERDRGNLVESVMLLPTPRAQNGEPRNQTVWARPLDQPQNLENALARIGAPTPPPSPDGPESSDDPHQPPLS